jgi:DNA processing protein
MTLDQAVALSLLEHLSRVDLTARLTGSDPELLECAAPLVERARHVRETAARQGIHVVSWNDARMPAALLAIPDCPPALWYRGSLDCFDAAAIAIVGSRHASSVSLETATTLAADLAARGLTIVSGLARGVDSAAHRGALKTGRTAAVLGSGVDRIYPPEHVDLANGIAARGAVISEYAPGTAPLPFHFPMRNRLISGLARAVVVIEAGERSGSLITASCALEQGRDVMAVPGTVLNGRNSGGHALIRDGATIVESAADIVEELVCRGTIPVPAGGAAGDRGSAANGSESVISADPVVRNMDQSVPYDLDALAAVSGLDAARLLPRLADLELRGLIRRIGGGRFMRS